MTEAMHLQTCATTCYLPGELAGRLFASSCKL